MGSSTKKHKKDRDSSSSKKQKHKDKVRVPSPPVIRGAASAAESSSGGHHATTSSSSARDREMHERERERERRHKRQNEQQSAEQAGRDSQRGRARSPLHKASEVGHRRRDRSGYQSDNSDVVEVPVAPPAPKISAIAVTARRSPSPIPANGAGDCLSVAETNKLRAKLGLKPLEETAGPPSKDDPAAGPKKDASGLLVHTDEWGEFSHKPAENIASKLEAEKLREKFRQKKEKRMLEDKLKRVKRLGDEDEVDDINVWLDRSRDKAKNRADADKRAKMLEEMDDQFGVGALVQQELRDSRRKAYTDRHLKGLKVDHEMDAFGEGKTVILTLKDQDVLNDEEGDTLVNVNMVDDERYKKNTENRKLNPNSYGYDVYAEQFDHFGNPIERDVLSKYDEDIDGGAAVRRNFTIGENLEDERDRQRRLLEVKSKLAGKRLESLDGPNIWLASDTYTEDEMSKFKKPKKKVKKVRQKLKADDLMPLPGDKLEHSAHLGRRQRSRITDPDDEPDASPDAYADIKIEEEDDDLEVILAKARRLKQKEALITKTLTTSETDAIKVEDIKSEPDHSDLDGRLGATDIVLNATAEFCRTLGDIPTYGMSGNRDVDAVDMMDDDDDVVPMDTEEVDADQAEEERSTGTWNSVNPDLVALADSDKIHEKIRSEVAILDEEPDVGSGVGAALKLALSKGYLEKEDQNRPSNTRMAHLQAKNYSIDDKAHNDDEKFQRRDRFQHGPISDFKEKDSYRPNVKLEYIDDSGRLLNEKEAFRYLSHKFHGKGPGKNKIEKRLKKNEQDGLLMKMSSTDTPLGTLTMLKHKQLETHSPYIVLSGSKQMQPSTSIVKHK